MKIIKRNGSEAVFDITKIISAITKANKVVPEAQRLTKQQIIEISDHVQEVCYNRSHAMNVEEIQDLVEDAIMATGIAMVHSRFSTNTNPSWERAHPNRFIVHNGEINNLRGHYDKMLEREETMSSPMLQDELHKVLPVVNTQGSVTTSGMFAS